MKKCPGLADTAYICRLKTRQQDIVDIVVDAGNTSVKVGVYTDDKLSDIFRVKYEDLSSVLPDFCAAHSVRFVLVCSVGPEVAWDRLVKFKKMLKLSLRLSLGISNADALNDEVGADRLALVGGTALANPGQNVLLIDAGTCVTYDFIDERGVYTCGNISPGLQLRLNSMHQFTSNLPGLRFAQPKDDTTIRRLSTASCMRGGAIDGLVGEILYIVEEYRRQYGDFKIVLTGGDSAHLAERLKNTIFAQPNYLLDSMHVILKHNIQICES